MWGNPQPSNNPISHWQQKRAIKKQYAAAKRANQTAAYAGKAAESTVKAAKTAALENRHASVRITHRHMGVLITIGIFIVPALLLNCISSNFVLLEGGLSGVTISTYPSTDETMLGVEAAYALMEAAPQNEVDNYETLHPGYDEYRYALDKIGHDPYVLISILSAWYGREWTLDEVQDTLPMLFSKQYQLSQTVTTKDLLSLTQNDSKDSGSYMVTDKAKNTQTPKPSSPLAVSSAPTVSTAGASETSQAGK